MNTMNRADTTAASSPKASASRWSAPDTSRRIYRNWRDVRHLPKLREVESAPRPARLRKRDLEARQPCIPPLAGMRGLRCWQEHVNVEISTDSCRYSGVPRGLPVARPAG